MKELITIEDFRQFQNEYGKWADRTFPNSTVDTIASHFREESVEFAGGLEDNPFKPGNQYVMIPPSHDPEEAADCLLLLLHHAHKSGYSLFNEMIDKAQINIRRIWDTEDEGGHGHFKHH